MVAATECSSPATVYSPPRRDALGDVAAIADYASHCLVAPCVLIHALRITVASDSQWLYASQHAGDPGHQFARCREEVLPRHAMDLAE